MPVDASASTGINFSLLSLLFGAIAGEIVAISPRLQLWDEAFQAWLVKVESAGGRHAANQACHCWTLLLGFHRCPPWQIDRPKLEAWLAHLAEDGMAYTTLRAFRGRISGFFSFSSKHPPLRSDPLFATGRFAASIRGAAIDPSSIHEPACVLRPDEARCLLRAVDRRVTLVGSRDYALLLALLLTGIPAGDLRRLTWGDVHRSPGPSDAAPDVTILDDRPLPPPAWAALRDYLQASGRLETIQPGDYVFPPLADPLLQPTGRCPDDWAASRPLSSNQLHISMTNYAAWAGFDPARVTQYSLRHTAAVLRLEAGDDAAALQRFLGRADEHQTRYYITMLGQALRKRGRPRRPWQPRSPSAAANRRRAVALRAVRYGPLLRNKAGGQPGNYSDFKHGFYYPYLLPGELNHLDPSKLLAEHLQTEIAVLRIVLNRTIALSFGYGLGNDPARALELVGRTTIRIMRLMVKQHELTVGPLRGLRRPNRPPRAGRTASLSPRELEAILRERMRNSGRLIDYDDDDEDDGDDDGDDEAQADESPGDGSG